MDALSLLKKYFAGNRNAFEIVLEHSTMVTEKAVAIVRDLSDPSIDLRLVEEAALLHD
ncbi:MAG: HD domain-containing protein, partial [Geobacteraceae bacterium]|nr:HD domain-containing protein [Geobacteraceae bacterium]